MIWFGLILGAHFNLGVLICAAPIVQHVITEDYTITINIRENDF